MTPASFEDGRWIVRLPTSRLTEVSLRRVTIDWSRMTGYPVRLDLRELAWIEPFGFVFLYHVLREALAAGVESIGVTGPRGDQLYYFGRMNFAQAFDDEGRVGFPDLDGLRMRRRDLRSRLLEFRRFAVTNDDEVVELAQQTTSIIVAQVPGARPLSEQIHLTLSEVLSNIEVHSGQSEGVMVAQTIGGRVHLAFGDRGVGIPSRIRSLDPSLADEGALQKALESQVSTRVGRGGMGLTELREEVQRSGTRMTLRSGTGSLVVRPERDETPHGGLSTVRGTIVEVVW